VSRHQSAQQALAFVTQQIMDEQALNTIKAARPVRGSRAVAEVLMKVKRLKN